MTIRAIAPIYIDCEAQFTDGDFFAAVREHVMYRPMAIRCRFGRWGPVCGKNSPDRQVVFLLDEIDELLAFDAERRPAGQLFKTLRAASQEGAAGSSSPAAARCTRTCAMRSHRSSIFATRSRWAGWTTRASTKSCKSRCTSSASRCRTRTGDTRLIELTSSHPNIAQWVCDRLVTIERRAAHYAADVEEVATTDEFHEQYVSTAWGDATALEKLITLLMGWSFQLGRRPARHWRSTACTTKARFETPGLPRALFTARTRRNPLPVRAGAVSTHCA